MATKDRNTTPVAVALEDEFLSEIDGVAKDVNDSRSNVMRRAIRAGLPLVKSGGVGDTLTLDSELSKEVDDQAKRGNRTRNSILLEAIKHGMRAVDLYGMIAEARKAGIDEADLKAVFESHDLDAYPEKRAVKVAMHERFYFWEQVFDLVNQVEAARVRKEAIERLVQLRTEAKSWKKVWNCGLSTAEIQWQIMMHEQYGHKVELWPPEEIEKRKRDRAEEDKKRLNKSQPVLVPIAHLPPVDTKPATQPPASTPAPKASEVETPKSPKRKPRK